MYAQPVRALILVVPATIGLLGCESTSSPAPVYERTVTPAMVTGAAAAALRPDGRFTLERPPTTTGQISLADAGVQVLQFARYVTNNVLLRGAVEAGRGGYWTDPHLLTLCDDVYFVRSQLGIIPPDSLSATAALSFHRRLGPQWLIALCGSAHEPQMTVQIAIDSNDIRFADGEPIEPYSSLTTAWFARGVPLNWPDALPISAERAVRFVFETFGVRIAEVPQLYFRGEMLAGGTYEWFQIGSARYCNRWRIVLEDDVTIRGSTTLNTATTNVLWIGALTCNGFDVDPNIHLPLSNQPTTVVLTYEENSLQEQVTVPLAAPVRFEIGVRAS